MSRSDDPKSIRRRNAAVTLRDVAREAGVGVSTVSGVLADKDWCYASRATRDHIHDVARKLHYVPNHMARAIRGVATRTIGVIVNPFTSGIQFELLRHISDLLWSEGYYVLTLYSHGIVIDREHVHALVGRGLDGVIVKPSELEGALSENIPEHLPCVVFDHTPGGQGHYIDRRQGSCDAARHLIEVHGHRRIGYLTHHRHETLAPKIEGLRQALAEAGLDWDQRHVVACEDPGARLSCMVRAITTGNLTAVMTSNDTLAAELIHGLPEAGLRVPEDVAVVGFDGEDCFQKAVRPRPTTVRQPVQRLASIMVDQLLGQLDCPGKRSRPQRTVVPAELLVGESCGCTAEASASARGD